jgi:hypothetical protein
MAGDHLQEARSRKPIDLSREQVAREIEQFLTGRGSAYDRDEFCTVPLTNAGLEDVRQRCLNLPVEFPPMPAMDTAMSAGWQSLGRT